MSDNRIFFEETADRLFADLCPQDVIAAAETGILPDVLWAALVENGITAMLVSEEKGGVGASIGDAAAILRVAGRYAVPGPLLETMLGNRLLEAAGLDPTDGPVALAFVEADPDTETGTPGTLAHVRWPEQAGMILAVVGRGDRAVLTRSAPADWSVTPIADASNEPCARLCATGPAVATVPLSIGYDDALGLAAVLRGAQMLGAIEWSLTRSVDYAGERRQFGREIGKFQVVQQMLAELADHMLASAGIVEAAAEAGTASPLLIAAARSRLGDAVDAAIGIAHQVHGALGFSQEYALNFRTRRLMAWRDDFGTVEMWRRRIAAPFLGLDCEGFWPAVADAGLSKVD